MVIKAGSTISPRDADAVQSGVGSQALSRKEYRGPASPGVSGGLRFFESTGIVRGRPTHSVEATWQID